MSNKIANNQTTKSLFRLYRFFLIILLICGYDFNVIKRKILNWIVRVYCCSLVTLVIYSSVVCCPVELSQYWSLLEYSASVIIIMCFDSRTEIFFEMLMDIDSYLRINRRHHVHSMFKLVIFSIITWSVRVSYTLMYCYTYLCYDNLYLFVVRQFSLIALDFNRVWRCIIFDAIRYRLKILRKRLEETPEYNYYLYVKNNKTIKEDKMKFCLYIYRSIADLVDMILPELNASLFLSVAGSLPKLVANVYNILTAIEGHEPVESLGYVLLHVLQISLLLFSPFVAVEFYSVEVDRMRLFLIHRLIDDNDPAIREDVKMFLRYTEIRTFKYRIWRIIPINISLPLELTNVCISYVIVIINYTHLYG